MEQMHCICKEIAGNRYILYLNMHIFNLNLSLFATTNILFLRYICIKLTYFGGYLYIIMKKVNLLCLSLGFTGLFFTSCLQEKNLYNPDEENQDNDKIGLITDFALKTEKTSVAIHATDINGKAAEGVEFGIYTSNPYSEGDGLLGNPAFVGYTNKDGKLEAKVVVANNITQLYIIPLSAGYSVGNAEELQGYDIQELITATFSAVPFPTANKTRAAKDEEYTMTENISSNFQGLCVPYQKAEVSNMGIPVPMANGGSSLVSTSILSSDFINQVNKLYPEKQNVSDTDFSKNSDIEVVGKNGAEVWVTYIGDGGFNIKNSNVYNSLMYYNYTDSELSSMNYLTPATLHMTMLLPNTNQRQCPTGLKIQLLYWDGNKYNKTFPEGTHIGFAVAREGYKGNGSSVTEASAYNFKRVSGSTFYPQLNGDVRGSYYSTPQLNQVGKSQAVTRWINNYDCCVTGFDIRPIGDNDSDYDFNDVLFTVSSSPVPDAVRPGAVIDPIEVVTAAESTYGTLAYEDLWPSQGDYDMNDFVVNYAYTLGKNEANAIVGVTLEFEPIAKGAASSTQIGFGIELPLDKSIISSVEGAVLEEDNENATFIIWDNVSNIDKFSGAFINTDKNKSLVSAEKKTVSITFKTPASDLSIMKFNPFIFVGSRSHEIHLPDYKPTAKMNLELLGTGKDRSDRSTGIYYRMEDMYSWALDFPRATKDAPAWRYPKEHSSIISAYPGYASWITDKSNTSWYEEKNANTEEIY